MTQQSLTLDSLLDELRFALLRHCARRRRRLLYALTVIAAGVTATVALGATYGHWLSSPNGFRSVAKPFALPAFSGTDLLTGEHVSKQDVAGRVGFVLVWQSYCPPCKGELSAVESFARANPDVPVIGLDSEDIRSKGVALLKQLGATSFPSISVTNAILSELRIRGYPSIIAFDKQGKVVAIEAGYGGTIATNLISQELQTLS